MNFESEFSELKKSFKEGSILTKITMSLGFFLTLSSLTNLSGEIIKWKGLILDMLNFYRIFIVEPVSYALNFVGLKYTETEIHVATISSICIAIGMGVLIKAQTVAFQNISKKYNNEIKPNLIVLRVVAISCPVGIWVWYGISDPTIRVWWVTFVSIFLPLFMVVPKVVISKFSEHGYYERGEFSYFKEYYTYLGALLLALCILAAINRGLTEKEDAPNKTVNADILASFSFWVATPLYPKLQSSQNAGYSWCYE